MKDSRVTVFRESLVGLLEALDAMVRVGRWAGPDAVPPPLRESAGNVVTRLGTANRLAASRFNGSIADSVRVKAIADAVRRLDEAYVVYCRGRGGSERELDVATRALVAEIDEIRAAV